MLASVDDLRSSVVSGGDISCFLLLRLGQHHFLCLLWPSPSGNAEISYFESAISSQINVARFDISMHITSLVDVLQPLDHLENDVSEHLKRQRYFFMLKKLHDSYSQIQNQVVCHLIAFVFLDYLANRHHVIVL